MHNDLYKVARLLGEKFKGSEPQVGEGREAVGIVIGPSLRESAQIINILKEEVGISAHLLPLGRSEQGLTMPGNNVIVIPAMQLNETTFKSLQDMNPTRVVNTPWHVVPSAVVNNAAAPTTGSVAPSRPVRSPGMIS